MMELGMIGLGKMGANMVEWLNTVLAGHRDLFEITAFSDPELKLISLAASVDRPLAAHSVAEATDGDRSRTVPPKRREL